MKKILLITILCSLNIFFSQAQKPAVVFSADKSPIVKGNAKLKILKNGNTACFEMNEDDGMIFKLYDTNRKKVSELKTPMKVKNIKMTRLRGVFEINNDVMIMIVTYSSRIPILYRYLYDGSTGKLKSEEAIFQLPIVSATAGDAILFGNLLFSDYFIFKDPSSDYYAVAAYDMYAKDVNKQIEITHFSPTHEKINSAFMPVPENKFKKIYPNDIYVDGANALIIAVFANTPLVKGGDEACYYVSKLTKGAPDFRTKSISTSKMMSLYHSDCRLVFNKVSGKIKAITKKLIARDYDGDVFDYVYQTIDPKTLDVVPQVQLSMSQARNYYKNDLYGGKDFKGIIQNYVIDQKGNEFVMAQGTMSTNLGSNPIGIFQDIAITSYTPTGTEIYGTAFTYGNRTGSAQTSTVYMNAKRGHYLYTFFDEFYGTYVDILPAKSKNYLILNNTPTSFEKSISNEKPGMFRVAFPSEDKFTTFYYSFDASGNRTADYLFGKPATTKDAVYALLHTADYNPETGLYATKVLEFVNGKKVVSIAWMTLN